MRSGLLVRALGTVIVAAGLCAPASGAAPTDGFTGAGVPPPLVIVSFKQATARAAVTYLSQVTGMAIDPMWKDAEHDEGLDPDKLVDLECRGMLPMRAVEALVQRIDPEATWQATAHGGLEVGPRSRLNVQRVVRIYDIRDLLHHVPNFTEHPTIDLQAALSAAGTGPGGGARSILREPNAAEERAPTSADRIRDLVQLLTSTVEHDQWIENGGTGASVQVYQDSLIVRAPSYIHRQLAATIADLPRRAVTR